MEVGDSQDKLPTPPEEEAKPGQDLPHPDLNPMTNPILGQNLGRWAQVYYTTPPEKRDQAVQDLLRELQGSATDTATKPAAPSAAAARIPALDDVQQEALICPACLHKNEARQRFCGLCGFPLRGEEPSVPAFVPAPPPPVERKENDWQWLREKNLQELAKAQHKRFSRKVLLVCLLLLGLAVVGTLRWLNRQPFPASSESTFSHGASASQPVPVARRTENSDQANLRVAQAVNPHADQAAMAADATRSASPPVVTPNASASNPDNGGEELLQGRRYLEGQGVPRNTAIAAEWLWKSVAKQNVDAVLLLSDLYVRGDGVPESCDQARILLRAAAQKGSGQARDRLIILERSGCP